MDYSLRLSYNLQFFAKEGPGGEKTEEPTSKRLGDARKKGQVAKSQEITVAADLFAFFILLKVFSDILGNRIINIFRRSYNDIPDHMKQINGRMPFKTMHTELVRILLEVLITAAPFFIAGVVLALLCNYIQFGFKVVTEPLKPKPDKFNPINGLKRIFSMQSIFNLIKSLLKISLISAMVFITLTRRKESIFLLYGISLNQGISLMWDIMIEVGIRCAAVYMIVAFIDFVYQKHKFHEDMKMTKQEVKDEYKDSEGDPQIKAKQKQKMREQSMRRMMKELPKADVVITNPTHIAVALSYHEGEDIAPRVVAKGEDFLAKKIKDAAKEHGIEIVENKPLARMLYANVDVNEFIPPELYKAVAEVLAYVYKLKGKV